MTQADVTILPDDKDTINPLQHFTVNDRNLLDDSVLRSQEDIRIEMFAQKSKKKPCKKPPCDIRATRLLVLMI
jgi:hypothetical protein